MNTVLIIFVGVIIAVVFLSYCARLLCCKGGGARGGQKYHDGRISIDMSGGVDDSGNGWSDGDDGGGSGGGDDGD